MVVFYVRNSLNPDGKVIPITVALSSDVLKSGNFPIRSDQDPLGSGTQFPNLLDREGEQQWILILETTELDSSGNKIAPEIVNVVTTGTVHQEIEGAMGRISDKVDWGTLKADTRSPELVEFSPPITNTTNVPIVSNIVARLQDSLPAAGIDFSTISVKVNNFDITSDVEFTGTIFDLTLTYRPKIITS